MVNMSKEILNNRLFQLEVPSSIDDALVQHVDLGTFFESGVCCQIQPEAGEPVYQWPSSPRIPTLQDHVEERCPVTGVLGG